MSHVLALAAILAVAAAAAYGWWRWSLWRHPYTSCRACGGSGQNQGSTRRRYGLCPKCGGKPQRLRRGARERRAP